MKNELTEKQIQNQLLAFLTHIGAFVWQQNSVGVFDQRLGVYRKPRSPYVRKGLPDIMGLYHGKLIAIEVKRPKGVVSPDQKLMIIKINEEGGIAFVARSLGQMIKQLQLFFPDDQILSKFGRQYLSND